MRIPIKLAAICTASLLAFGCGADEGDTKKDDKTTDAGSSSGADGASSSSGADGASSSSGADGASSSSGADGASSSSGGDAGASSSSGGDAKTEAKHKTCSALGDCVLKDCGAKAFAADCEKQCLEDSSDAAIGAGAPLLTCVKEQCINKKCKDVTDPQKKGECVMECMPAACGQHLFGCLESGKDGDKICGSAFECFDKCDEAKGPAFGCWAGCYNGLNADGKKGFKSIMDCAIKNGGFESKDTEKKCAKEFISCQLGGKWGTGTCGDTLQCMMMCDGGDKTEPGKGGKQPGGDNHGDKKDDDECTGKCFAKGSETAFDGIMSLGASDCLGEGMGNNPACADKLVTCLDPQGSNNCTKTLACTKECIIAAMKAGAKDDEAGAKCSFECIAKADPKGAKSYWAVAATCLGDDDAPDMPGGATPVDLGPTPMCVESAAKCVGAGGGGESCGKIMACASKCGDGKDQFSGLECGLGCAAKASKDGIEDFKKHAECAHTCAKSCAKDKDSKACATTCWTNTKGCPEAKKACTPPKS